VAAAQNRLHISLGQKLMRILIVDDDKSFASVLAQLVDLCQHEVAGIASSGLEAIRFYQRSKPDVVLMDYKMQKLNGLTACRNILSNNPAARIIFVSGIAWDLDLSPRHSGAVAVLRKPVTAPQLKEVLDNFAESASTTAV
jgi:CheY-like chemotaxis protein